MPFLANGECLNDIFVTEEEFIDRFVGQELWNWGSGLGGRLGINSQLNRSSPVQTVSAGTDWRSVVASDSHTAGIKTDGSLWLWGFNSGGRLGTNTIISASSPVQTVSGGTNWKHLSLDGHSAAIKTDGTLWLWGYSCFGRLGDNTLVSRSSPVQTISGGTSWCALDLGNYSTGAIKTDGTLWLWGYNFNGQLGNNSILNASSPVQTISGGTNWRRVSLGHNHSGAIKTDGTLWLWGTAACGILGNNTCIGNQSSPIQTISGGTNWRSISLSCRHSAGIKIDGTLWLWGYNAVSGSLGDNTVTSRSSPVQTVSGGTNWRQVSLGYKTTTSAVKTDGTLWVWGNNGVGILGTNDLSLRSSPVQTLAGGTTWISVSVGGDHMAALKVRE
jgi:alpha-tubulin suppressor-like RCC1 family protein